METAAAIWCRANAFFADACITVGSITTITTDPTPASKEHDPQTAYTTSVKAKPQRPPEAEQQNRNLWEDPVMRSLINLVAKVDPTSPPPHPELELGLPPRMVVRRPRRSNGVSEAITSVAEFHLAFNLPIETRPQNAVRDDLGALRVELLREEFEEFADAVERSDLTAVADALADIVYVAYGSALTYGIDLDAVLREVHRANMSKLGPDGRPLMRDDGKVLKPATYSPPDVHRVLLDQPPLFLD